jgi:leucyl aminopeptidase (aminopeptidase T)
MKDEAARLSKEQQPLYRELLGRLQAVRQEYMPRSESSFCIIAFPTPEIGEHFETLFDATVEINSLDNKTWETLQQKIIDVIDRARFIHVKGTGANKTDINVMMQPLRDPEKETNFVNCTADVNIPVGEVFTSPQLKGTKGVLHLEETFLNGLKYENLQLHFKDGHISDYSCSNFQSEAENRKYIEENLLNHREELPIGEFAIGTNTLAYKVAVQYNIMPLLPILIIEKMGPHFAIGDTCFSHEEDHTTFNPDGKKITAVDNEVSALRKTDPQKAYTNCHTDITLPYEGLEHITAVFPDGTASPIIKDGLFAIDGLEKLNEPLLELRKR